MPASTACRCALASRSAAIRSGGSPSCTCTSKEAIASIFRTMAALEALVERERPRTMRFVSGGRIVQGLAPQVRRHARRRAITARVDSAAARRLTLAAMAARAAGLDAAALASRLRSRRAAPAAAPATRASRVRAPRVLASGRRRRQRRGLHRPRARGARAPVRPGATSRYVGVGPAREFPRAPLVASVPGRARTGRGRSPSRRYAPLAHSAPPARSGASATRRGARCGRAPICARTRSSAAATAGRSSASELAGIALLQLPWSARAMDEAAAALDALPAARGRHLRRSRRLGPRASCSNAAGAAFPSVGSAARLHLPPLAELPARARRDGGRRRAARRPRLPAPDAHAALRRLRGAPPRRAGTLPRRRAWPSPAARGSTRSSATCAR